MFVLCPLVFITHWDLLGHLRQNLRSPLPLPRPHRPQPSAIAPYAAAFFLFLSPVTEGFFLLGKKTQTYGKIEGKHGKQIWKKLEKELNLWTIKVMTPTSRPFPRAQALASEIKKEPPSRDQLPIRRSLTGTDLTKSHLVLNLAPTYSWLVVLTILQMVYIIWSIYLVNNG